MYKSIIKKIIVVCLICVLLMSTFVFSTSAVHGIYRTLPIARPPCDSSYGYVEVVVDHNNGTYGCFVYIFQLLNTDEDSHVVVSCSNNSRTMNFSYSGVSGGSVNVFCMNEAGTKWELGGGSLISDTHTKGDIIGIHCYGPALTINLSSYDYPFSLLYSEDSAAYVMLNSILQELRGNNSEIIDNQNQNTQQIIQNQQQIQENEKTEAQEGGNANVDSITSVVPNDSQGFIDSIQSFSSAMSYNGTQAYWTLPPIKIPAINGVMNEITLTDSLKIDFAYWIQKIPSNILSIVQIVCTLALLIFCFKELYSIISYVLTLRGSEES